MSKTQQELKNASSNLNTKVSSTSRLRSISTQSRNLRAATILWESMSPLKIDATFCRFPQRTKWTKRLTNSRKLLHPQQLIPARRWLTTIKSSC